MARHLLPALPLLVVAVALTAAPIVSSASAPELSRALAEADSLDRAGARPAALALLRPAIAAARAAGDSASLLQGLLLEGRTLSMSDRAPQAEPRVREALRLAEALADTERVCRALNILNFVADVQGREEESRAFALRMRDAAILGRRPVHEATARTKLAQAALEAGDAAGALPELEATLALYRTLGRALGEADVLNRLGTCLAALGRLEDSTRRFQEAVQVARREKLDRIESAALNNLAGNAHYAGHSDLALDGFRRVFELERANGRARMIVAPACNLAELYGELGQFADAESTLSIALKMAQAAGEVSGVGQLLCGRGFLHARLEGFADAKDAFQACLDLGDAVPADQRIDALRGLADAVAGLEGPAAGLAVLEAQGGALRPRASVALGILYDSSLADRLLEVGRRDQARVVLQRMDEACRAAGIDRYRVAALTRIARCQQEVGQADSALVTLRRAAQIWERERAVPLDPAWREQRAANARALAGRWMALELRPTSARPRDERAAAAFEVLQRFKGRTLVERVAGPGGQLTSGGSNPPSLREVQTHRLRPGELLLDTFVAADTIFAFAVTRDSCRIYGLPGGERELEHRLKVYRDLVQIPTANPRANPQALAQAAAELRRLLLDPIADLVTASQRLLFSPDGPLNLLALAHLRVPASGGAGEVTLLEARELVLIPTAALLSPTRTRPAVPGGEAPTEASMLVVAGVDAAGLPGARREVDLLASRYASARRWIPERDGLDSLASWTLARYDLLHIAGHTQIDDQHPWRSGILLAAAPDSGDAGTRGIQVQDDLALRAGEIAELELHTRLAVLSSCASAGGRVVSGEGVQGLTTAFLDAGVGTVIATLWPVDDSATMHWVRRFYRQLERGESVAAASRAASAALRAAPLTADPYYWAGFVVVGDGDVVIRLRTRRQLGPLLLLMVGTAGVVTFELVTRRRRLRRTVAP